MTCLVVLGRVRRWVVWVTLRWSVGEVVRWLTVPVSVLVSCFDLGISIVVLCLMSVLVPCARRLLIVRGQGISMVLILVV